MSDYTWPELSQRQLSISSVIADQLSRMLATQFSPGDKLPAEREIAERMGVSRTSVREAIHELSLKGQVERRQGLGTIVTDARERPVELLGLMEPLLRHRREVVDLREVCEPAIASRSASRATDGDLARMEDVLGTSDAALSAERATELDEQFHASLARACQNPLLVALMDLIQAWLHPYRLRTHKDAESRQLSIDGHHEILRAVRSRDPDVAATAMIDHIRDTSEAAGAESDAQ